MSLWRVRAYLCHCSQDSDREATSVLSVHSSLQCVTASCEGLHVKSELDGFGPPGVL